MFEWVYFARMDSVIEGIPVYKVREDLGRALAEKSGVDADMVVPVPDSGRSAAMGYAMASGIPFREVFRLIQSLLYSTYELFSGNQRLLSPDKPLLRRFQPCSMPE